MVSGRGELRRLTYKVTIEGPDLKEDVLTSRLLQVPLLDQVVTKFNAEVVEREFRARDSLTLARESAQELLEETKNSRALRGERHPVTVAHDTLARWLENPEFVTADAYILSRTVLLLSRK